jgi:hypothetical protein
MPTSRHAFAEHAIQFVANEAELRDRSDPYFRTFDMRFPDYWNLREWEREFDGYAERGDLPALSLVRLAHDHFGAFDEAMDGVDTPDTQMADNDYALGLLVEKIAKSRFARDTVVLVVEDDAQDGADHVDAHRSLLLVAGAQVRQGARVSTPYTTVNVLRTIEELLGLQPMNLLDANAAPIAELFERQSRPWSFRARVPAVLRSTRLPLPKDARPMLPRHGGSGFFEGRRARLRRVQSSARARTSRALRGDVPSFAESSKRAGTAWHSSARALLDRKVENRGGPDETAHRSNGPGGRGRSLRHRRARPPRSNGRSAGLVPWRSGGRRRAQSAGQAPSQAG